MKKIKEYTILGRNSTLIIDAINDLIKEGWQSYGYPFVDRGDIYQAMVKYED